MAYKEEEYLLLSGIQHFVFCRRQWALIHIENQWVENVLTAEGRLEHRRVHETSLHDKRNGVLTIRGLQVKSERLGLTGVCDAVEFIPVKNGIRLKDYDGIWQPIPVEYKHGEPKVTDCDRVQAAAQAICLEEMFCCTVSEVCLFYKERQRRERITLDVSLRETVIKTAKEMHDYYTRGYTPRVKQTTSCKSCSLKDICLPKLQSTNPSVKKYISGHLWNNEQ